MRNIQKRLDISRKRVYLKKKWTCIKNKKSPILYTYILCWGQNKGWHRSKRREVSLGYGQNIHKRLNLFYSDTITCIRYIEWLREGYSFCWGKSRIDGFCETYTRYGMFPINLRMNQNHCCGEGVVLRNLNVLTVNPDHVTRKSATRQAGV